MFNLEIMTEKNMRKSGSCTLYYIIYCLHFGGLSQQFYNFLELPRQRIRESLHNMAGLPPEGRVPISVAVLRTSKVVQV